MGFVFDLEDLLRRREVVREEEARASAEARKRELVLVLILQTAQTFAYLRNRIETGELVLPDGSLGINQFGQQALQVMLANENRDALLPVHYTQRRVDEILGQPAFALLEPSLRLFESPMVLTNCVGFA